MKRFTRNLLMCILLCFLGAAIAACGAQESQQTATSEPAATPAAAEEPAAEEPAVEESAAEEPAVEEPAAEEPAAEEPAAEEPAAEEPAAEEPAAEEPAAEVPAAAEEPAAEQPAQPQTHIMEIADFAFSQAALEIKAGDTVTFINKDAVKHSATADDKSWDTGLFGQNEEVQIVFATAGEFSYYCAPHPAMKGKIIVTGAN